MGVYLDNRGDTDIHCRSALLHVGARNLTALGHFSVYRERRAGSLALRRTQVSSQGKLPARVRHLLFDSGVVVSAPSTAPASAYGDFAHRGGFS